MKTRKEFLEAVMKMANRHKAGDCQMNSSLLKLCNLIADQGANYAHQHTDFLLKVVKEVANKSASEEQSEAIFKIFSFLGWAYANGVWSNLSIPNLRKHLMGQSMKSIVLRTAYELAKDKSNKGVAFLAAQLDQEFRDYVDAYIERIKELPRGRFKLAANTATLCGLEWIQQNLDLNAEHMKVIRPRFNYRADDVAKIEQIARRVNRASVQRKKGFLSKLFGY